MTKDYAVRSWNTKDFHVHDPHCIFLGCKMSPEETAG